MVITKLRSSQNPEIPIQPLVHCNLFADQALKITNPKHSTFPQYHEKIPPPPKTDRPVTKQILKGEFITAHTKLGKTY